MHMSQSINVYMMLIYGSLRQPMSSPLRRASFRNFHGSHCDFYHALQSRMSNFSL
jgi:hypothetical protein